MVLFCSKCDQVAPIVDGFILERGMRHIDLGGRDVTNQLGALVNAKVKRTNKQTRS